MIGFSIKGKGFLKKDLKVVIVYCFCTHIFSLKYDTFEFFYSIRKTFKFIKKQVM